MKHKLISTLFLIIFLSSLAFASDSCEINENCTRYAYGVTGEVGVNISYTYPNSTFIGDYAMVSIGDGTYYDVFIFNTTGNYLACAESYNSTSIIGRNCESFYVGLASEENQETMFGLISFAIIIVFILLIFTILHFVLKINSKNKNI